MGFTKATSDYLDAGGIIKWITTPKTSAFTAVSGEGYLVDTTSAAITVTLPTSPSEGDEVTLVDYGANAATNNITITSSDDIEDSTNDVFIDYNKGSVVLFYSGATKGWLVKSAANETATALNSIPLTVDYLIVAGGGAGGGSRGGNATIGAGGGGAGGYKTATSYSLSAGTNYSITIGAGGSGNANAAGDNGSSSSFNSITATGGDGGGSSGGDSGDSPTNTGGTNYTAGAYWGAGGGAGTGSGQNGSNGASGTGGTGGDGYQSSITGTATYYGGGGGGGIYQNTAGSGGLGGGGNGLGTVGNGNAGTANTGGGGGGAGSAGGLGSSDYSGGAGGSGVVIIRYPNTFTITIGSGLTGSTSTDGSDKVTTFTAGTGTISFT